MQNTFTADEIDHVNGDNSIVVEQGHQNTMAANSSLPNLEMNRASSTGPPSVASGQPHSNGNGAANYTSPLPAGHQQDLNYLYNQIQELSSLLKANREKTAELARVAQEVQVGSEHQRLGERC